MADIEIVVKLSEKDVESLKRLGALWVESESGSRIVSKALLEGTILPKGHGRIGDLDALEQEMIGGINAGNFEDGYDDYAHINDLDDCVDCVRYADAIIEADKESPENDRDLD